MSRILGDEKSKDLFSTEGPLFLDVNHFDTAYVASTDSNRKSLDENSILTHDKQYNRGLLVSLAKRSRRKETRQKYLCQVLESRKKEKVRGPYKKPIQSSVIPASELVPDDGQVRIGIYKIGKERQERLDHYRERRRKRLTTSRVSRKRYYARRYLKAVLGR